MKKEDDGAVPLSLPPPPIAAATVARPRRPPHMMRVFSRFSPKKVPFEDTTEAVVALAVRGTGRRGGEVGWRCGGWRGGVGGVVGGFWSTRSRPYLYNLLSQFFVTSYFFLQPKSGNRQTSIRDRAEGDGSGKPKAWEAALRLTRRPALSSVFWCVGTGRGHGLEYDGGSQCSPPQSQVRPFFVGTCIYANISRKRHHSLMFAGGE